MLGALFDRSGGTAGARFAAGSGSDGSGHGFDGGCRSSPHDVCASGDGPLVDFGPSQLDFAVASGVSFSLSGGNSLTPEAQDATSRVVDGVHGSATHR